MIVYACYNWTVAAGDLPDRFIDDQTATEVLSHLVLQALHGRREVSLPVAE